MLNKTVENIPYKALVIDNMINPVTGIKAPIIITLYRQDVSMGRLSGTKDDPIVVFKNKSNKEVIPRRSWSKEMINLSDKLILLYPVPELKDQKGDKTENIPQSYFKWASALITLLLIIYIIYRKVVG